MNRVQGFTLFNLIIFMALIGILIIAALPMPTGQQPYLDYYNNNKCEAKDLIYDKSGRTFCKKKYPPFDPLKTP